tara:strand:+ start:246 stop:470 length:225 start_codon:yes stop_codon:yes gene_type:complete
MEKKKYLIEITYHENGNKEVTTLNTDDLAWSMNQYQRNRKPFTWEILDVKEILPTLDDVEMIQQGIKNYKNDNS